MNLNSQKKKWYEKSYRRGLIDMHIEDWDEIFLSKYDPKVCVENLKKANIQSAMVYSNSHVGYCYWPTKSGYMHKGIKGRDVLGEFIDLAHKGKMDIIVYYSLIFNNWAYDKNPSWRMLDENGRGSRERAFGDRYGLCCPNSEEYRSFIDAQVKEICTNYDFEGIFFDMTYWPMVCYCPSCVKRFEDEAGCKMPRVIDWSDQSWLKFQNKREEWLVEFAEFATGLVRKYRPGVTVEHTAAVYGWNWRFGTTTNLVKHSDYVGGDLHGGFAEQMFIDKFYYSITPHKPFESMTARCYPRLSDHTTMKPVEMLKLHNYIALAHNGAFLFIDAIDPVGTINPKVYEVMGKIFGESSKYEAYLGGDFCQDVAIYYSMHSKMDFKDNGKAPSFYTVNIPHLNAAMGAAKALKGEHIPFGVIGECNFRDLSDYQILILPDVLILKAQEAEAVREFVSNGGSLYASGHTSLELLSDVFGVKDTKDYFDFGIYISPNNNGEFLMPGIEKDYPLIVSDGVAKVQAFSREEVMATVTLPFTNPKDKSKFASIHSNPPGIATEYPAIIYRNYGKGKVLWTASPIEAEDKDPHRRIFAHMIRELSYRPFMFKALNAPYAVEITLFHQKDKKRFIISLVNEQEQLPPIKVSGIKVQIALNGKKPKSALLLPECKDLPYEVVGGYAEITVPELDIFHMLALSYEYDEYSLASL
jgi:hypothetical protein